MKIRLYLILGVFISPLLLSAQDELTTSDNQSFESWNALQIHYAPTEKLSLGLERSCNSNRLEILTICLFLKHKPNTSSNLF